MNRLLTLLPNVEQEEIAYIQMLVKDMNDNQINQYAANKTIKSETLQSGGPQYNLSQYGVDYGETDLVEIVNACGA